MNNDFFKPDDLIDLKSVSRVLVIKFRNLGDVLLMTPVLTVLKRNMESTAVLDALVYEDCSILLLGNPDLNQVLGVKRGGGGNKFFDDIRMFSYVRSLKYDLVINLTEGDRGALITGFSGAKTRVGLEHVNNLNKWWKRRAYSHWYRTSLDNRHAVEQGLDSLRRIGLQINDHSVPLSLKVEKTEQESAYKKMETAGWRGKPYLVVHPTSRWLFKCLSAYQVSEFINKLSHLEFEIVITSGPDLRERSMLDRIIAKCEFRIVDLGGRISLKELAAIIEGSSVVVGADSVPIHMAAALGKKVLVWYGPSNDVVWGPWMTDHQVVSREYSCRPCGFDGCGGGKLSECLVTISNREITESFDVLMKKKGDVGD